MKKYEIISAIGFVLLVFSAVASDSGINLSYTVSPAILGVLTLCYGLSNVCRIYKYRRMIDERIHKNRAEYRAGWGRANGNR